MLKLGYRVFGACLREESDTRERGRRRRKFLGRSSILDNLYALREQDRLAAAEREHHEEQARLREERARERVESAQKVARDFDRANKKTILQKDSSAKKVKINLSSNQTFEFPSDLPPLTEWMDGSYWLTHEEYNLLHREKRVEMSLGEWPPRRTLKQARRNGIIYQERAREAVEEAVKAAAAAKTASIAAAAAASIAASTASTAVAAAAAAEDSKIQTRISDIISQGAKPEEIGLMGIM